MTSVSTTGAREGRSRQGNSVPGAHEEEARDAGNGALIVAVAGNEALVCLVN
jgi:hypothetical protein